MDPNLQSAILHILGNRSRRLQSAAGSTYSIEKEATTEMHNLLRSFSPRPHRANIQSFEEGWREIFGLLHFSDPEVEETTSHSVYEIAAITQTLWNLCTAPETAVLPISDELPADQQPGQNEGFEEDSEIEIDRDSSSVAPQSSSVTDQESIPDFESTPVDQQPGQNEGFEEDKEIEIDRDSSSVTLQSSSVTDQESIPDFEAPTESTPVAGPNGQAGESDLEPTEYTPLLEGRQGPEDDLELGGLRPNADNPHELRCTALVCSALWQGILRIGRHEDEICHVINVVLVYFCFVCVPCHLYFDLVEKSVLALQWLIEIYGPIFVGVSAACHAMSAPHSQLLVPREF